MNEPRGTVAARCPNCSATIVLKSWILRGAVVCCRGCGWRLEVVSTAPLRLAEVHLVDQDWYE